MNPKWRKESPQSFKEIGVNEAKEKECAYNGTIEVYNI